MDKGKRRSQPDGMTGTSKTFKKRRITPSKEQELLFEMKKMLNFNGKINEMELSDFLRTKISDLEKRETVGIFGRKGSGKSSLINAVIGEKDLLPSGDISACTTVIIKVEANMKNGTYEAEIEFIPLKDAKDIVCSLKNTALAKDDSDDEDEVYNKSDAIEELSGLYGANWEQICSQDDFMNKKYFRQIPELFNSVKKTMAFKSAGELSRELIKYTRGGSQDGVGEDGKRFWPLVKCVTIRVPNNDLLQNVTLVDLPGTGDNNKTRDNMWKGVVSNCSTVWIVTEITRPAADKEAWEILTRASSLIGNGGQCQRIHFICTKSDSSGMSNTSSAAILQRNKDTKEAVKTKFSTQIILKTLRNHFHDECFEVFTVSAKEFQQRQYLDPVDTEIPKLQEVLQSLNDRHSETLTYVRGAYGILSLIQGARAAEVEEQMKINLNKIIHYRKKLIYNSLVTAIEENMSPCYDEAKQCSGKGSLEKIKTIIQNHIEAQKNVIFEEAKEKMMSKLRKLMDDINKTVEEHMKEAIEHSLKTNFESLPDVEQELKKVTEYYNQLKEIQRTSQLRSPEGAGPSTA